METRIRFQNNTTDKMKAFLLFLMMSWFFSSVAQSPDEQYMAGCAYLYKGEYDKAAESFSLAISRNNSDEKLYILRGNALLNNDDSEKALEDFKEANLIMPNVADLWLARAYAKGGDPGNAIVFLERHLNSPYKISEDSIKKDPAFDRLQDTPEWHTLWQKEWYNDVEKAIAEAAFYSNRKQFEEAISYLDEKISRNPSGTLLIMMRGKVFMKQGNFGAAIGDFSSAMNADKAIVSGYALRGSAYLKAGRFKEAVSDFTRAIRNDPGKFELYQQRAQAYAGQKNFDPAIKDMALYLKYFEDDLHSLYECGEYYYAKEDYMDALKCFNRNLTEDPNNPVYFKARGKTYLKTGTFRYAVNDLSMALDLNPNDSETWMFHGVALIRSGNDSGCSSLKKSQSMGNAEAVKYILENCR